MKFPLHTIQHFLSTLRPILTIGKLLVIGEPPCRFSPWPVGIGPSLDAAASATAAGYLAAAVGK